MIEGLIGAFITALFSFIVWLIDRRKEKIKSDLEIEKLKTEIEKNKQETEVLKKEKKETEIKLQFLNRIMDLEFINEIGEAVNRIFESTKAGRFLILVAKNGKVDFNTVSVVFEQHKEAKYRINAIARYRNVQIDDEYKKMLKEAERNGLVHIKTSQMPEDSILRDFYELEGITHSKVRFLARKPIDSDNDFLVYSSLSTYEKKDFTKSELAFIKTQYEGTILPCIDKIFD